MYKGAIFDFDGVIVDTERKKFNDMRKILKRHGYVLPKTKFRNFIGKKTDFFLKENFDMPSRVLKEIIKERRKLQYVKIKENTLVKGIRNILNFLESEKFKIAISTGSRRDFVKKILKVHSLNKYFCHIVAGEDFSSSKPNPECYILTIKKLKLLPEEIIIIEDSAAGVAAAKKTGCEVFAVKTYIKNHALLDADKVFNSHSGLLAYLKKNIMKKKSKD